MSLTPIAVPSVPTRLARQGVADEESQGLFDLIAAAAAAQASAGSVSTRVSGEQIAFGREASGELPASLNMPAMPMLVAAGNAQTQPVAPLDSTGAPTQVMPEAHDPDATHHHAARADESAHTVRHGTLPVIVSGQLIELELLRERRRDAGPARRLSMVLDSASAGSVTVNASLHGDRLIVELDCAAGESLAARNEHEQEVQQLARRLGWQFTETVWESNR